MLPPIVLLGTGDLKNNYMYFIAQSKIYHCNPLKVNKRNGTDGTGGRLVHWYGPFTFVFLN